LKSLPCILLLLLPAFVSAQERNEWRRIFTYEDGTVLELNTAKVTFGPGEIGRVKFRVVWAQPDNVPGKPGVQFKTRLETIELKCSQRRFRRYDMTLLDLQDKPVYTYTGKTTDEWEEPKAKNVMNRIFEPACALLNEQRHKPDEELGP
jgi:hypothetical protein